MLVQVQTSRTRTLPALILAITALASHAERVHAQVDQERWYSSHISPLEFERILEALELKDEGQEAEVRALYEDLQAAYVERSALVRESFKTLEETRTVYLAAHPEILDPWAEEGKDFGIHGLLFQWQRERRSLEERCEVDVSAVLNSDRRFIWIEAMQRLRRQRVLPEVRRLGQIQLSADLVAILNSLDLREEELEAVKRTTKDYVGRLDEVLRAWERNADTLQHRIMNLAAKTAQKPDSQAQPEMSRLRRQIEALAKTIASVNRQYVDEISSKLTPGNTERFIAAVRRVEYPNVFEPSPVDLVVEALRCVNTLDAWQREAVESIYNSYCPERGEIRRKIVEALELWERPGKKADRWDLHQELVSAGEDPDLVLRDHPVVPEMRRRRALAEKMCHRLRNLFTDEEFAAFPLRIRILLDWISKER